MQKQCFELVEGFRPNHKVHLIVHDVLKESKFAFFLALRKRVVQCFRDNPDIELVHCNDGVCAFFCQWIKKKYNIPVALTFHGLDLLWPNRFYQAMLPRIVSNFDALICVSDYTADECLERGFEKDKVHVVYNGVDLCPDQFPERAEKALIERIRKMQSSGRKILVSIGRPVLRKGFSWFVRNVMPGLRDDYYYIIIGPETRFNRLERILLSLLPEGWRHQIFLFFGWTSDQDRLQELEQDPSFSKSFVWYRGLSYQAILYALANSDLFVMPNVAVRGDAEGFGLVALESVIQGSFVLAADTDGIPSAVTQGENGWLIGSGQADDWIEKIASYFEQSLNTRTTQIENAQSFVKSYYSWHRMVKGYERVFEKLVAS